MNPAARECFCSAQLSLSAFRGLAAAGPALNNAPREEGRVLPVSMAISHTAWRAAPRQGGGDLTSSAPSSADCRTRADHTTPRCRTPVASRASVHPGTIRSTPPHRRRPAARRRGRPGPAPPRRAPQRRRDEHARQHYREPRRPARRFVRWPIRPPWVGRLRRRWPRWLVLGVTTLTARRRRPSTICAELDIG